MRRCILCCSSWLLTTSSPMSGVPLGESFGEAVPLGPPHQTTMPGKVTDPPGPPTSVCS